MASNSCLNFAITHHCVYLSPSFSPNSKPHKPNPNHNQFLLSRSSFTPIATCSLALHSNHILSHPRSKKFPLRNAPNFYVAASAKAEPLKVMISGAPASGKGTQCELITEKELFALVNHLGSKYNYYPESSGAMVVEDQARIVICITIIIICQYLAKWHMYLLKYGLVHIAAGDLLRVEVAAASENGKRAKEYMEKGELVPDEIVVMMVRERLLQPDSQEKGWLLDGYPRSSSQAAALEDFGIHPDIFILLEVPEDILVERVVGRRLDPLTGKIYHLKYSPPESKEIASRLTQRFDDTEEKVKLRLHTHHQNVEAVLSTYKDITVKVNGNVAKENVFAQIDAALTELLEQRKVNSGSLTA